jgi:hypothetical protein
MNHPADDALLHAVHEPRWADATLLAHLEGCAACRLRQQQLAADDAAVGQLLAALDHPAPAHSVAEIVAARPRQLRRRVLLAAQITLFVAGAAAAMTVPASPLHRLLFGGATRAAAPVPTTDSLAPAAPARQADAVGIALPAPASLVVEFREPQTTGTLEVHVVAGDQVTVRSRGGTVAYTVHDGRVQVDNRVAAELYIVEIPASLHRVKIVAGSRVLFQADGNSASPMTLQEGGRVRIALADSAKHQP